jgi:hypothetical protein
MKISATKYQSPIKNFNRQQKKIIIKLNEKMEREHL